MKANEETLPTHQGLTWKDMPGSDTGFKRLNFALFKRGKLSLDYVQGTPREQARMAINLNRVFKKGRAAK